MSETPEIEVEPESLGSLASSFDWLLSAATVFLGAGLLFGVEPMIAKSILPWFGGAASVWTACMLFFQTVLLLGYSYAHVVSGWNSPRRVAMVHVTLLAASLAFLTVLPQPRWKPTGGESPVWMILGALGSSIGLPFFLLSSTSPLIQSIAARRGQPAPYRLFALSNLASFLALIGYPVVVEPFLTTRRQAQAWSVGYVCYALLLAGLLWRAQCAKPMETELAAPDDSAPLPRGVRFVWMSLAACASALFLAATNHICQSIAPLPFLWVVPLGVYLLSFILCFDGDKWYRRKIFLPLHAAALAGLAYAVVPKGAGLDLPVILPAIAACLFCLCMYCHGELVLRRPPARYLTQYYLLISLGCAIGALLVSVIFPMSLAGIFDFPATLVACAMLTLLLEYGKSWIKDLLWSAVAIAAVTSAGAQMQSYSAGARAMGRNFYGGVKVLDGNEPGNNAKRTMFHGVISHGSQFLEPTRRRQPITYYAPVSGVGLAIRTLPAPAQVAVIGLGAGTLAAYGRKGDQYRFYEINPLVIDFARREFTYLGDSDASVEVVLGDGRLSLERESSQKFDLLVVDAFSGDSIPVHLLSLEAFDLYFQRLKPNGVLALHISNASLDLEPVVQKAAELGAYSALLFHNDDNPSIGQSEAVWALLTSGNQPYPSLPKGGQPLTGKRHLRAWTDGYSNLLQILK